MILQDIDVVVHLAARVHVMREQSCDPLSEYRKVNTAGTVNLASSAVKHGVKRFIYISTIKVNGEQTTAHPFTISDSVAPVDPYALSKWEAEQALWSIASDNKLEVVVARPPLIYGPGVKGNIIRLIKMIDKGLPLPFGAIDNKRSLIGLDNFISFLLCCIQHPEAAGHTFLVSDGHDVSTPELIREISIALSKNPRLLAVPVPILNLLAKMTGRQEMMRRLLGSLQVDSSQASDVLGWHPNVDFALGISKTVAWYRSQYQH